MTLREERAQKLGAPLRDTSGLGEKAIEASEPVHRKPVVVTPQREAHPRRAEERHVAPGVGAIDLETPNGRLVVGPSLCVIKRASGETLERALNGEQVRRVSFDRASQSLSETASRQLATGRILFAGPRSGASTSTGGYGQPGATNKRRVDATFQEME